MYEHTCTCTHMHALLWEASAGMSWQPPMEGLVPGVLLAPQSQPGPIRPMERAEPLQRREDPQGPAVPGQVVLTCVGRGDKSQPKTVFWAVR